MCFFKIRIFKSRFDDDVDDDDDVITSSNDSFNSDARSVDFFRELVHSSCRVFVRVRVDVAQRPAV